MTKREILEKLAKGEIPKEEADRMLSGKQKNPGETMSPSPSPGRNGSGCLKGCLIILILILFPTALF